VTAALALLLAAGVAGAAIPEDVLAWAGRQDRAVRLAAEMSVRLHEAAGARGPRDEFRAAWNATPAGWPKMRFLGRYAFGPTLSDYRWRPLPPALFFLYRLLRPLRLGVQR
jgi:hypothetical protein